MAVGENGEKPAGEASPEGPLEGPSVPGRLALYNIEKAVGKGGYAVVYKGFTPDGKVVAIKKVEVCKSFGIVWHGMGKCGMRWYSYTTLLTLRNMNPLILGLEY